MSWMINSSQSNRVQVSKNENENNYFEYYKIGVDLVFTIVDFQDMLEES